MSAVTKEVIDLMEILPKSDQNFALEFIKKNSSCMGPRLYKSHISRKKNLKKQKKILKKMIQFLMIL